MGLEGDLCRNALSPTGVTYCYKVIVEEIKPKVVNCELEQGDSLLSERGLGERHVVSRTVVREAIKLLSEKQLVTVIRGKGVVEVRPTADIVT